MKRPLLFIVTSLCIACTSKPKHEVIKLSPESNGRSIKITGLSLMILKEIAADTASNWQSVFAIYRMPTDTDMKDYQPAQLGKYVLKDSTLVYTPDTPFTYQHQYFLRYFQYAKDDNMSDLVRGKKRTSKIPFTDFVFKSGKVQ